jgi:hypothetical protein
VRAGQLAATVTRCRLARSLREVVSAAEQPPGAARGATAPVHRQAVLAAREGLLGLADRLVQPVQLNPSGIARVSILLRDGAGPLYSSMSEHSISEAIWWVADGLQLCLPPPPSAGPA